VIGLETSCVKSMDTEQNNGPLTEERIRQIVDSKLNSQPFWAKPWFHLLAVLGSSVIAIVAIALSNGMSSSVSNAQTKIDALTTYEGVLQGLIQNLQDMVGPLQTQVNSVANQLAGLDIPAVALNLQQLQANATFSQSVVQQTMIQLNANVSQLQSLISSASSQLSALQQQWQGSFASNITDMVQVIMHPASLQGSLVGGPFQVKSTTFCGQVSVVVPFNSITIPSAGSWLSWNTNTYTGILCGGTYGRRFRLVADVSLYLPSVTASTNQDLRMDFTWWDASHTLPLGIGASIVLDGYWQLQTTPVYKISQTIEAFYGLAAGQCLAVQLLITDYCGVGGGSVLDGSSNFQILDA